MNLLSPLVLIVDIENIRPPLALEQSVTNAFCGVSVLKIAVGNWKLLNCDREFQARGYHLFHVPQGKDSADLEICQMTELLGNSSKVVIVSNDKIFINLAVQSGGLQDKSVYIVRKHENRYFLSQWMMLLDEPDIQLDYLGSDDDGERRLVKFNTEDQLVTALQDLLAAGDIFSAKTLADRFKAVYEISIREIIKSFGIQQNFSTFLSTRGIMAESLLAPAAIAPPSLELAKAISTTLEKSELIKKVRKLIIEEPDLTSDLREFGQQWRKLNGVGLREHMQQVGIPGTPAVLIAQIQASCNNVELN